MHKMPFVFGCSSADSISSGACILCNVSLHASQDCICSQIPTFLPINFYGHLILIILDFLYVKLYGILVSLTSNS